MGLDDLEFKHIACLFVICIIIGGTITVTVGLTEITGIVTEKGYSKSFDGESNEKDYWIIINGEKIEVSYYFIYRNANINDTITIYLFWDYGYKMDK
jgi:hypothetical protein